MALTKSEAVREMFTRIAARYDLMNSLMTAGRHHAWRRLVATAVAAAPPGLALDLATGTGDLAIAVRAASPGRAVVAADFSEAMLRHARAKLSHRHERGISVLAADALALPFADATFACVTSAFLLRNLADLPAGLAEMRRVTRAGGLVAALEITRPGVPGWDAAFGLYFNRLVPMIGSAVAGDRAAYTYLPESVERFVTPRQLAELMREAGLRDVRYRRLALGTIAIHVGAA
ncbi:MAG TPA: ubiquinone/menaquinone biosynthesis methyltransferase [Methylomirabilota bacterium]|nr:ubiquinone/menaquinone biosynthesis methyltransferase [Methylomirabilota bacterium]